MPDYSLLQILIETYWNVNDDFNWIDLDITNINRDILECKLGPLFLASLLTADINRDILECK